MSVQRPLSPPLSPAATPFAAPASARSARAASGLPLGAEVWSSLINLAGRQRMLSQRLALLALLAERGDAQARDAASQILGQFSAAHSQLSRGGDGLPPPPTAALHEAFFGAGGADGTVRGFIAAGERWLRGTDAEQALAELLALVTPMLALLNRVTAVYEAEARAAAAETERRGRALIGRIEQIAGEARVVSLNARIVAARAGEVGREFSVVAARLSEVSEQIEQLSREAMAGR